MTKKSQKFRKLTAKQIEALSPDEQEAYGFELGKRMGLILKETEDKLNKLYEFSGKKIKIAMNIREITQE